MNNQNYNKHLKHFLSFLRITQSKIAHVLMMSFFLQAASPFVTQATTPLTVPMQTAPTIEAVVTRHAPTLNNGRIEGNVRALLGESFAINGGTVTGSLFVPGTPTLVRNGNPTIGQTVIGTGSPQPTGYTVTVNSGASLGKYVNRTDAITMPTVAAPPTPTATRNVSINTAGQSVGDWATLRNLTLNSNVGQYVVPAGTYGNFTANSGAGFTLGVAGATQPTVYNFQQITINSNARILVAGPVIVNLAAGTNLNGPVGALSNPQWLQLNVASGGVTLNSGSALYGFVTAPNGTVTVNASTELRGNVISDRFTFNGGLVVGVNSTVSAPASLTAITPTTGNQGQTITVTLTGANTTWNGTTQASFGAETSVGGAAYGQLGTINVTSATTATAQVAISPTAALEPRSVTVVTGTETVTLSNVFFVKPATPPGAANAVVSTLAGSTSGFADGISTVAKFNGLVGLAVNANDEVFVADAGNNRIRKVDVNGNVTTFAGNGTAGFVNGAAATAQFNTPNGVAVDTLGNVFVADTGNNRIRKIDTTGAVTTVAGDGTAGYVNGAGATARFNAPRSLAVDPGNNLYIADTGNSAVRVLRPTGSVETLAGDGTAGDANTPTTKFNGLAGIAFDGEQLVIYLADSKNHKIKKLSTTGQVITLTGAERGFKDGTASEARFAEPSGIAADGSQRMIVADTINSLIRQVDAVKAVNNEAGAVRTIAGTGDRALTDGTGTVAKFFTPRGVVVQASSAIIVADTGNNVLRKIVLPPTIASFTPSRAQAGQTVTLYGERFDGRATIRNTVKFAKAGGGQTNAIVVSATRTTLTVTVPADAATGTISVTTEGGTTTTATNFEFQYPAPAITSFAPDKGYSGDTVTLTGTNLKIGTDTPTVTFQGQNGQRLPALVTSSSATQVAVTVPNGAITGTIELTTVGGTATTATNFIVDTRQNYQITLAPTTITTRQGATGVGMISLTSLNTNFTQLAKLTIMGLPTGVTANFTPEQITAGATSTLSLVVAGNAAAGSYPFTVTATALADGVTLTKTTAGTLTIQNNAGQTTLAGRVLNTDNEPVIGATVSTDGKTATSDAAGAFTLSGVTAGTDRVIMVDGRTASAPGRTYPVITEPANIIAGQANQVPYTFYLPNVDTQYEVTVIPNQITNVTTPRVNGLQMIIPANANLRNRDGSPVTRVSITPVPIDRTPAPLPDNIRIPMVYTSQPGGAIADVEMPVVYPNLSGINPNTQVPLYNFNHDTVQWYIYGYGRVSSDGKTIVPEINPATGKQYGLSGFSWHGPSGATSDGNTGGEGGCPSSTGNNPVNFSTGIKMESTTDVVFGGARGVLNLTRVYTSDMARLAVNGRFGRGWKDNWQINLNGNFVANGAGRVIMPNEQSGRLFSYARTESDGTLIFESTATVTRLSDVVRKLTNGAFEYRTAAGSVMRFDANGRLTASVDRNGNTITLGYTGNNLTTITDAVGRSLTVTYNSNGFVSQVTDPIGRVWRYNYDFNSFQLSSITDPLGHITRYEYDNSFFNQLTKVTDARGNLVKKISYYTNGRVFQQQFADEGLETYEYTDSGGIVTGIKITDPLNRVTTKRFESRGYVLEQTDELGQVGKTERDINTNLPLKAFGPCGCAEAVKQFDARGNVTSSIDRLGQTMRTEYEPIFNNVTKVTDKMGRVTTFTYDAHGNLTSMTNALNQTIAWNYDQYGQLLGMTDALGHTSSIEYDAYGNIIASVNELGNRTQFEYDLIGHRLATVDPLGRRTSSTFDAIDRITTSTDTAGTVMKYEYDANSNLIAATDALGRTGTIQYDVKNRVTLQTDVIGRQTSMTYNVGDELITSTSPSGRQAKFTYDARGQRETMTDPLGGIIRSTYDYRGNLTALKDQRGSISTVIYDDLARPISVRDPVGRASLIEYNSVGDVQATTDRLGRRKSITYDILSRPLQVTYADATVTTTYDADGRVTSINDTQSGSVAWTYDNADRRVSETSPNGTVSYSYNAASQMTAMTAADRAPVNYAFDVAGRLRAIAQGAETFTYNYDTLSRMSSMQRPNGVTTNYAYDQAGRVARVQHNNALNTPIEDLRYTFTRDDEISSITSLMPANLPAAKTIAPADAANRVSQSGNVTYSFDPEGQTTSKSDANGTTTYRWDARSRLTGVTLPNSTQTEYSYDALGRRASRTANNTTTKFLYNGADVVVDKVGNTVTADYLNGPGMDNKLRQTSNLGNLYFLQNQIGSTIALTGASGGVVEQPSYEPFGASAGSALTRYDFTGRERDNVTGLMHYRAREYDPQQGRFLTEDPAGFKGGLNKYSYVSNNPVSKTDPMGLYESDVHYYLTKFLALNNKCFTAAEAEGIAFFTQNVDDHHATTPGLGILNPDQQYKNMRNHALHDMGNNFDLTTHWKSATRGDMNTIEGYTSNIVGLGTYMHYLQDTFSHEGFTDPSVGHVFKDGMINGHMNDQPANDPYKAMRMAGATWKALNDWAKAKKCCDGGGMDDSMQKKIWEFVNAPSAGLFGQAGRIVGVDSFEPSRMSLGFTNSHKYLDNKLKILGLQPR